MTITEPLVRVAGLDLSVTSSGLALPNGNLYTLIPKAKPSDRARRLYEIIHRIDSHLKASRVQCAFIEDYFIGRNVQTALRLGELGGVVRERLFELNIPYVDVENRTLKRYATGNGGATKDDMVAAAQAEGADPRNDDEADAFWLQRLGLHGLTGVGPRYLAVELRDVRGRVLRSMRWPAGVLG